MAFVGTGPPPLAFSRRRLSHIHGLLRPHLQDSGDPVDEETFIRVWMSSDSKSLPLQLRLRCLFHRHILYPHVGEFTRHVRPPLSENYVAHSESYPDEESESESDDASSRPRPDSDVDSDSTSRSRSRSRSRRVPSLRGRKVKKPKRTVVRRTASSSDSAPSGSDSDSASDSVSGSRRRRRPGKKKKRKSAESHQLKKKKRETEPKPKLKVKPKGRTRLRTRSMVVDEDEDEADEVDEVDAEQDSVGEESEKKNRLNTPVRRQHRRRRHHHHHRSPRLRRKYGRKNTRRSRRDQSNSNSNDSDSDAEGVEKDSNGKGPASGKPEKGEEDESVETVADQEEEEEEEDGDDDDDDDGDAQKERGGEEDDDEGASSDDVVEEAKQSSGSGSSKRKRMTRGRRKKNGPESCPEAGEAGEGTETETTTGGCVGVGDSRRTEMMRRKLRLLYASRLLEPEEMFPGLHPDPRPRGRGRGRPRARGRVSGGRAVARGSGVLVQQGRVGGGQNSGVGGATRAVLLGGGAAPSAPNLDSTTAVPTQLVQQRTAIPTAIATSTATALLPPQSGVVGSSAPSVAPASASTTAPPLPLLPSLSRSRLPAPSFLRPTPRPYCPRVDLTRPWGSPLPKATEPVAAFAANHLMSALYEYLYHALQLITYHYDAWPFREPVDTRQVTDYLEVVKKPIDLRTMREKLGRREYTSKKSFMDDLRLMFLNCRTYNVTEGSIYREAGAGLEAFSMKVMRLVPRETELQAKWRSGEIGYLGEQWMELREREEAIDSQPLTGSFAGSEVVVPVKVPMTTEMMGGMQVHKESEEEESTVVLAPDVPGREEEIISPEKSPPPPGASLDASHQSPLLGKSDSSSSGVVVVAAPLEDLEMRVSETLDDEEGSSRRQRRRIGTRKRTFRELEELLERDELPSFTSVRSLPFSEQSAILPTSDDFAGVFLQSFGIDATMNKARESKQPSADLRKATLAYVTPAPNGSPNYFPEGLCDDDDTFLPSLSRLPLNLVHDEHSRAGSLSLSPVVLPQVVPQQPWSFDVRLAPESSRVGRLVTGISRLRRQRRVLDLLGEDEPVSQAEVERAFRIPVMGKERDSGSSQKLERRDIQDPITAAGVMRTSVSLLLASYGFEVTTERTMDCLVDLVARFLHRFGRNLNMRHVTNTLDLPFSAVLAKTASSLGMGDLQLVARNLRSRIAESEKSVTIVATRLRERLGLIQKSRAEMLFPNAISRLVAHQQHAHAHGQLPSLVRSSIVVGQKRPRTALLAGSSSTTAMILGTAPTSVPSAAAIPHLPGGAPLVDGARTSLAADASEPPRKRQRKR